MNLDLSTLQRRLLKRSGEEDSVWPCLALTVYSDVPFPQIGKAAATALCKYLDGLAPNTLRTCLVEDEVRPLTSQRLARGLKRLESPPKGDDGGRFVYSSSLQGSPADHSIYFALLDLTDEDLVGPFESNVLRFEWPWSSAEGARVETFVDLVASIVELLPASTATAGFGFSYWHADRFAADQVQAMLGRYLGFDHSDVNCNSMRGYAPAVNWLTYLSKPILDQLNTRKSLLQVFPPQASRSLGTGQLFRAARRPPVGDSNNNAADIGFLPTLARWTEPQRFTVDSFTGSQRMLDTAAWLQRLDRRADGAWENRD